MSRVPGEKDSGAIILINKLIVGANLFINTISSFTVDTAILPNLKISCLFDPMLNHQKSDVIAVPTVRKKGNYSKLFYDNIAGIIHAFCWKQFVETFFRMIKEVVYISSLYVVNLQLH